MCDFERQDVSTMYYDFDKHDFDKEMTEETLETGLAALIRGDVDPEEICWENLRVETFEEAGVMTYNKGLVVTLPDGSEFQLTIVRSR